MQECCDVRNVQVPVDETSTISLKLLLIKKEGVFLESTPSVKPAKEMQEDSMFSLTEAEQRNDELEADPADIKEQLPRSRRKLLESPRSGAHPLYH